MKRNLFRRFSKSIVRTLPVACVILSLGVTCFAANTNTAVITFGNISGAPGSSVVVPISLATTGSDLGPTTFGFDLSYDSTKFDTQSVVAGPILPFDPADPDNSTFFIKSYPAVGTIRIGGFGTPVIPNGVIVNVTFRIKSDATPGTYTLTDTGTLEVIDTNAEPLSASIVHGSITVTSGPLAITTTSLLAGMVGTAYSQTVHATGGAGTYHWSISSGALPGGLAINATSGAITGTPTTTGTFNFTARVADSQSTPAVDTQTLSILINPAPPAVLTITTTTLPAGMVGNAYSQTVHATGGAGTYHWSISSGALPGGLAINATSGAITGTPTTTTGSPFSFTVRVADSQSTPAVDTQALSIVISPAVLTITTTTLPAGMVGNAYSQSVSAINGAGAYHWSISSGSLPTGFPTINASTGVISGTPSATGTFNFIVRVADSQSTPAVDTQALSIVINALPTFVIGFYDESGNLIINPEDDSIFVDTPIKVKGALSGGDESALAMSQWVINDSTLVDTVFVDTTVSDSCWLPANMLEPDMGYTLKGRAQNINGAWSEWVELPFNTITQLDAADANNDGVPDDQTPTDTDLRTYGFNPDSGLPDTALIVRFDNKPILVESTDSDTMSYFAGITPSEEPPTGSAPVAFRTRVAVPKGASISLTYTFSEALPAGTKWYKYDESAPAGSKWTKYPDAVIAGSTVIVDLTDGDTGDADGVANGVIIDPAGPVTFPAGSSGGDSGSLPVGPLAAGLSAFLVWFKRRKQR